MRVDYLGILTNIIETGAAPVFVIEDDNREILIPA